MNIKSKPDIVFVASNAQLSRHSYYRRLWVATRNLGIPRRTWLDEIANTIRDSRGIICHYNGMRYDVPLVDEVFGDDQDMRWLGYFFMADQSGHLPKMRVRKLERLRLIDLYMRIKL